MSDFKASVQVENLATGRWTEFKNKVAGEEAQTVGEGEIVDVGMVFFEGNRPTYIWRSKADSPETWQAQVFDLTIKRKVNADKAYRVLCPELPPPSAVDVSIGTCLTKFGRKPVKDGKAISIGDKVELKAWRSAKGSVIFGF